MKYIKYVILILLCFSFMDTYADSVVSSDIMDIIEGTDDNRKINPLWEEYNKLSDEEKLTWNVIPEKYITEFDEEPRYNMKSFDYATDVNLPSSYDLRDVNGVSYVTPNKNQSSLGICWAFSTNASFESNIIKSGLATASSPKLYSERQLDYISASPTGNLPFNESSPKTIYAEEYNPYSLSRRIGDGGNFNYSGPFMAMGVGNAEMKGLWKNFTTANNMVNLIDVYNLNDRNIVVSEYIKFPNIDNRSASSSAKEAWRRYIKEHIINYGAVYTTSIAPQRSSSYACFISSANTKDHISLINWNAECESSKTTNYQYDGLHAMTIIGWDDNYTQSYCAFASNGTTSTNYTSVTCKSAGGVYYTVYGAWLLKNSWGSTESFVHLAYNSSIGDTAAIKTSIVKDFDNTYNYVGPIYYAQNSSEKLVKYFYLKGSGDETLKRISFETTLMKNTTYRAYLLSPDNQDATYIGSVQTNLPGRYAINCNNELLSGDIFEIVIVPDDKSASIASSVYAFTNNETDDIRATSSADMKYSNGLEIRTRASNLISGSVVTYRIYDSDNNDISYIFNNLQGYIVAGAFTGVIHHTAPLESGIYHIETYYNNNLIGSDPFAYNYTPVGSGTEDDPYLISTVDDFRLMFISIYRNSYFRLANDLNLYDYGMYHPDYYDYLVDFTGAFDGNNHTIYNLNSEKGLFNKISGHIKNLKFTNVILNCNDYCGVLSAESENAIIENISVTGVINAQNNDAITGGIIGHSVSSKIVNSYSKIRFNGGYAGSHVGLLDSGSSIKNSLSLSSFINTNDSISTFAGDIVLDNNSLENLIDYNGRVSNNCNTLDLVYNQNEIIIKDVLYYESGACKYLGTPFIPNQLRNGSLLTNFDKTFWNINNGKLPSLKNHMVTFYDSVSVNNEFKNVFIGDVINLNVVKNPTYVTYPDITFKSSNSLIASISSSGVLNALSEGLTTITISTNDGSHIVLSMPLYVMEEQSNVDRVNNYILYNQLTKPSSVSGYTVDNGNSEYVGTGMNVRYIIEDNVVGEFTAVINGDLSGDGEIDSLDLAKMLKHISGAQELEGAYLYSAHLNNDDEVDSLDLAYLLNKVAGKEGY